MLQPPMLRMSCSPLMGESPSRTEEEQRFEERMREHMENAGRNAPTPSARNMYPSCETVE